MQILTGERIAVVQEVHASVTQAFINLDFDFGAREASIINAVEMEHSSESAAADLAQETLFALSMDPDDAQDLGTVLLADFQDMDSSLLTFMHTFWHTRADDGAGGGTGAEPSTRRAVWNWSHRRAEDRPLIVRNLRVLIDQSDTSTCVYNLVIRYQLAELTLNELGFINATRR